MIYLCELFSSIQGEGPFTGRPALFVRLAGCRPPFCPWCDTPQAWTKGEKTCVDDILSRAAGFRGDLVVITGGEPFLQWDAGLCRLEKSLMDQGFFVQYETSGKAPIPKSSKGFKVCSPKYLDGVWQMVPENIVQADCFKFVVDRNLSEVEAFIADHSIPANKVWIMPLGATREDQLDRSPAVWQYCAEKGFNFSPRVHTLIFNTQKGV